MVMDEADREIYEAQRDASLERFRGRRSHEIERIASVSSVLTASSASSASLNTNGSLRERPANTMSRAATQNDLERHPTVLSRIQTAKSQHSATVGRGIKSTSRASRKPLPEFGDGKPYPPPLPDQEDYVVEFDGPDDPIHAQNWPFMKK